MVLDLKRMNSFVELSEELEVLAAWLDAAN